MPSQARNEARQAACQQHAGSVQVPCLTVVDPKPGAGRDREETCEVGMNHTPQAAASADRAHTVASTEAKEGVHRVIAAAAAAVEKNSDTYSADTARNENPEDAADRLVIEAAVVEAATTTAAVHPVAPAAVQVGDHRADPSAISDHQGQAGRSEAGADTPADIGATDAGPVHPDSAVDDGSGK